IILDALDPATGKRKRKWHSFKGTKREAQVRCAELIASRGEGRYVEPGRMTVGECLDRWLIHVRTLVSPRAHECYGETVNFNLKPALGAVRLSKLRSSEIDAAYAKALESGRRTKEGGLAPSTVRMMHRTLSQALTYAVRQNWLTQNPAINA